MFEDETCVRCAHDLGMVKFNRPEADVVALEETAEEYEVTAEEIFDATKLAKAELAERRLCRKRLLPYVMRMVPEYDPGWVHADICMQLEQFELDILAKKSPRLMLFLPPRAGKSELGSKRFPAWFLGRNPKLDVVISSYSGDLAEGFSRSVRNSFETEEHTTVFPKAKLAKDSKSAAKWHTNSGGAFNAVGVSGALSGKGGSLLIVDDPHKDRNEAESDKIRQTVKDWYSSTLYTRRAPGGGILVIQTRWHEDDLSGWLLECEKQNKEAEKAGTGNPFYDKWKVVKYPAIATTTEKYREIGEPLNPERFPLHELEMVKNALVPRDWHALYQQSPVSDDGDYFTKSMLRYYSPNELPALNTMRIYAACDLAISQKQTADYSVFVVIGVDMKQNLWLLDLRRGRYNSLGLIDQLFDIQDVWNPEIFGIESGQIELTLEPFIKLAEDERHISLNYEKLKTKGMDKVARARPIQGRMEQGKVFFPSNAPWLQDVVSELLKFPLGVNDDIVDALAWIGQMLLKFGIVNQIKPMKDRGWLERYKKGQYGDNGKTKSRSAMSA